MMNSTFTPLEELYVPNLTDKRDPQTYAIIGAAMEVHRELKEGFLEAVYGDALEIEFTARGIPHQREVWLTIYYKGKPLKKKYKADFICFGSIIIELKAVERLVEGHRSQTVNYLEATRMHRALLLNFGEKSLKYERIVSHYTEGNS